MEERAEQQAAFAFLQSQGAHNQWPLAAEPLPEALAHFAAFQDWPPSHPARPASQVQPQVQPQSALSVRARPASPEPGHSENGEESQRDSEGGTASPQRKRTHSDLSEEGKKKRRQAINKESARRSRARRQEEFDGLKTLVAQLKDQQGTLLRYTAQLAREKNGLAQRLMELTDRWNVVAAENIGLHAQLQSLSSLHSMHASPLPQQEGFARA